MLFRAAGSRCERSTSCSASPHQGFGYVARLIPLVPRLGTGFGERCSSLAWPSKLQQVRCIAVVADGVPGRRRCLCQAWTASTKPMTSCLGIQLERRHWALSGLRCPALYGQQHLLLLHMYASAALMSTKSGKQADAALVGLRVCCCSRWNPSEPRARLLDARMVTRALWMAVCREQVLIWNQLARGNAEFCAILVAVNSVLQVVLYSPLALFYLKVRRVCWRAA